MRKYRATREWGRGGVSGPPSRITRSQKKWPKVAGVAIVLCLVFFFGRNFGIKNATTSDQPTEVALDIGGISAGSDTVKDVLSGSVLSIPLNNAIVLDGEVEVEANIAQDTTAISVDRDSTEIGLIAVGGTHGSGSSSVQFLEGSFQHIIVASLPDPPVGYFYEGWLLRSKPFDFFSTGKLIQHADDLKWYLLYNSDVDKRDYKKIVVTLEPEDGDIAPADHVLEGQF